jgi:hypothetical protein
MEHAGCDKRPPDESRPLDRSDDELGEFRTTTGLKCLMELAIEDALVEVPEGGLTRDHRELPAEHDSGEEIF